MQKKRIGLALLFSFILIGSGCSPEPKKAENDASIAKEDGLNLLSSDETLVQAFNWAKNQAMAYVHDGEDPVGKWYEAALPNRQAFCMRDVSHQVTGANVLGLYEHNANMLCKFAANISESKDWCSYWEINKDNVPAPVDYRNDKEFWYNLPANFDVLNAAWSHYLWTGDQQMIKDSIFLHFYQKTLTDYIDRWDLSLDKIYTRKRFMNMVEKVDSNDYFHMCRGIPGYDEGQGGHMIMGLDQLVIMGAAFRAAGAMEYRNGNLEGAKSRNRQFEAIKTMINTQWWDEEKQAFKTFLMDDGSYKFSENKAVLFYRLTDDPVKWQATMKDLNGRVKDLNIESASHLPEVFYQYGALKTAYETLLYLCDEQTERRDYPEVSFAVVGSIATGMFGIKPDARTYTVMTQSRLSDQTAWAELENIPVLQNKINLRHSGHTESIFTNKQGQKITWKAFFPGHFEKIAVDGTAQKILYANDLSGQELSGVVVGVEPGQTVRVVGVE